ncbi:hypothetical protein KO500_15980 [Cellulophaga baltica]|uniref:hypothetical protein n=1 Tax=Cellulophaga TaxID=104264 RepID=UPI001C07EA77|nr:MULTISPECIES: hypothetical protein [Cellulophaga]MBU2997942.1 hypothetical protein [Cellulophaga baltica]MDO6769343.1 hypothetical protein [Cellulophaga sp. 1_MG-2023]
MQKEFKIITEGVIIIASSESLKHKYKNEEFNYDFPSGFSQLSNSNSLIALTTTEGDDVKVVTRFESTLDHTHYDKIISQYLAFDSNDKLLILSHAEFTMICSRKQGDFQQYGWPLKFTESIDSGSYKIEVGVKDVNDDFDQHQAYFKLDINIMKTNNTITPNQVVDISE